MKEIVKILGRRYSSVSVNENVPTSEINNPMNHKSFRSTRSLSRGLSIVDTFFNQRATGKQTRSPKRIFVLMSAGIIAICGAILSYFFQPYDLIFKWKLIFEEGGEIFDLWAKPPVDLYIKIYLFNITNANDFMDGKADKLKLEEIGPYVYREELEHTNVTFNQNGTLSTIPNHPLVWQEHLSVGREDDLLYLPNIALLSIAQVAAEKSYFFRFPINVVIRQSDARPLVKMTAKEFMFGYETTLTTLGNTFMPNWITFEKVGLVDRMYDFTGDFETIYTGETNPAISGLYDTFHGSPNLPQWEGDHCSSIRHSSDGTKFKSFIEPNETLLFFRKTMCRPQRMVKVDETEVSGLQAYKFMFENNALDNGAIDKKNKCFCRNDKCLHNGLIDVTDCYYGFPIVLSYPHYLNADPEVSRGIGGLEPNYEKHHSYFMIQPKSGLPLKVSVKFQINMALNDISSMTNCERFSHLNIPMLWFEIAMHELPEPLKNRFNLYLNILPVAETLAFWLMAVGGVVLLIIAIARAVLGVSSKISQSQQMTKYNGNKNCIKNKSNLVYSPCEEKISDPEDNTLMLLPENQTSCDTAKIVNEGNFMLDQEPALSDDDSYDGSDDSYENRSQNNSIEYQLVNSDEIPHELPISDDNISDETCELGPTSSLIIDIANDDFYTADDEPIVSTTKRNSISHILDGVGINSNHKSTTNNV